MKKQKEIKAKLQSFIKASEDQNIDSPLYTYLPNVIPPKIRDEELDEMITIAKEKEETVSKLVNKAEILKMKVNLKNQLLNGKIT